MHQITESYENPEIITEQKVSELKGIALRMLNSMPSSSDLTDKQKETLAKDAVIFALSKNQESLNIEETKNLITARISKTLYGINYRAENNHDSLKKGPSHKEQMKRHSKLLNAIKKVKENPSLRQQILLKIQDFLQQKNGDNGTQNEHLSPTQTEDIVTNFIHFVFTNKTLFSGRHSLAVLQNYYTGREPDKDTLEQALAIFSSNFQQLFDVFLESPDIKAKLITKTEAEKLIPESDDEKELMKWNYVLLQHGNINARNQVLLSLQRFIYHFITQFLNKNGLTRKFIKEDLYQAVSEKLMEKLCLYDVKQGSPLTYLNYFLKHVSYRILFSMALIPQPAWVHYQRYIQQKYLQEESGIRPVQLTYIDKMIGEDHDIPLIDFIPGMQTEETPESEAITKDINNKVSRALKCLSEREKEIILLRSQGVKLQIIADKYGLSRQRVEQLEKKIIRNKLHHVYARFQEVMD